MEFLRKCHEDDVLDHDTLADYRVWWADFSATGRQWVRRGA